MEELVSIRDGRVTSRDAHVVSGMGGASGLDPLVAPDGKLFAVRSLRADSPELRVQRLFGAGCALVTNEADFWYCHHAGRPVTGGARLVLVDW